MALGHTKKRKICIISVLVVIVLSIGGVIWYFMQDKENVSFDSNDKLFFSIFADMYEPGEYEFYSLDAYYLKDTQMYYYNAKFKGYTAIDDTWSDIEQVCYGRIDKFNNMYCRSWDELYGFEETDKEFERAQIEGVHKTYTKQEIEDFLKEAYKNKE